MARGIVFVPRQSTVQASSCVVVVHVLKCGGGRRLTEIDELVLAIATSYQHEATAGNSTVVHANHSDAELSSHQSVGSISALLENFDSDFRANRALGSNGT